MCERVLAVETDRAVIGSPDLLGSSLRQPKLLNRFISARTYRAVAKPDRQTDGEAKPRLRRISDGVHPTWRGKPNRSAAPLVDWIG